MEIDPHSSFLKELAQRSDPKKSLFFRSFFAGLKKQLHKIVNFREIFYALRMLPLKQKNIVLALIGLGIISLTIFFWKLNNLILIEVPSDGGAISEGIIGTPRFINPILAISDADRDVAALVYSGLMRPDGQGGLETDLAESYETSSDGLTYIFTLKPDILWPDGKKITADDIIFTIEEAKNPAVKSPRRAGWEGVEVKKMDARKIQFTLKKPYAPFLENTTLGILPKHLWENALAEQMIFSDFNISPVGSGPYRVASINRNSSGVANSYILYPNNRYSHPRTHIQKITLKFYPSEETLLAGFRAGEVSSMSGISPKSLENLSLADKEVRTLFLPRVFGVFFNQNANPVFAGQEVRKALSVTANRNAIIMSVFNGYASAIDSPIPSGTFGYLEEDGTVGKPFNSTGVLGQASGILSNGGWTYNEGSKIWEKKTKKEIRRLAFSLETSDVPELKQTAEELQKMWQNLGADVTLKIFEAGDLNQNVIRTRNYNALLFGVVMGRDPDPFAFWHSSQRNDPGLNIASYTNTAVDKILETARGENNPEKRKNLYADFERELNKDTPAVFLYSPKFIYVEPKNIRTTKPTFSITVPSERFSQVDKWFTATENVWRVFAR